MNSLKCFNCGLTNWSTADACKRCGATLAGEDAPFHNHQTERAYYPSYDNGQFADPSSSPQVKGARMLPMGVLMIILGSIITVLFLGATARGASFPLYFLVLGISLLSSGAVFCMRKWEAVYVYLLGFGCAVLVMFLTESVVQKPFQRLAGPTIIGLSLLNKLLKAKKAASVEYAEQYQAGASI